MKTIKLSSGQLVKIDNDDFELVSQYHWHAHRSKYTTYARATYRDQDNNRKHILMHRLILNTPNNLVVDHINKKGLDNRKVNIRNVTKGVNNYNVVFKSRSNKLPQGVTYHSTKGKKYVVRIKFKGKSILLGMYNNKKFAGNHYKKAFKFRLSNSHMNFNQFTKTVKAFKGVESE